MAIAKKKSNKEPNHAPREADWSLFAAKVLEKISGPMTYVSPTNKDSFSQSKKPKAALNGTGSI